MFSRSAFNIVIPFNLNFSLKNLNNSVYSTSICFDIDLKEKKYLYIYICMQYIRVQYELTIFCIHYILPKI